MSTQRKHEVAVSAIRRHLSKTHWIHPAPKGSGAAFSAIRKGAPADGRYCDLIYVTAKNPRKNSVGDISCSAKIVNKMYETEYHDPTARACLIMVDDRDGNAYLVPCSNIMKQFGRGNAAVFVKVTPDDYLLTMTPSEAQTLREVKPRKQKEMKFH